MHRRTRRRLDAPAPVQEDTSRRRSITVERQSSAGQVRDHRASPITQGLATQHAVAHGYHPEEVERVVLAGETARPFAPRPQFQERVLNRAAQGDVGAIFTYAGDRLLRNLPDHARLMEVAQQHRIKIVIDGREYDPWNEDDEFYLGIEALISQLDGRRLAKKSVVNRVTAANERTMWVPVSNGFVWAYVDDADFQAAMRDAGLGAVLAADAANVGRRLEALREGFRVAPFKVPDESALEAYDTCVRWFREEGRIGGVQARIRDDARWPRREVAPDGKQRGVFPFATGWWHPGLKATWRAPSYNDLSGFLYAPATFGIFAWISEAMLERARTPEERKRAEVRVDGAWEGYVAPAEYERFMDVYDKHARHRDPEWGARAPRDHLLSTVRCGHERPDGAPCGRVLGARQPTRGTRWRYSAVQQADDEARQGHLCPSLSSVLDDVVTEVVTDMFGPAHLDASTRELLRLAAGTPEGGRHAAAEAAAQKEVRRIKERLARAESAVEAAEEDEAARTRARALCAECERDLGAAVAERDAAAERRARAAASQAEHARRVAQDVALLERTAGDVPGLLARAGAAEAAGLVTGARRQLVDVLVRAVHVRRVGPNTYRAVIEFPDGTSVERPVVTGAMTATAAERAWCIGRCVEGAEPDDVARELNTLTGRRGGRLLHRQVSPWTAGRVQAVALRAAEQRSGPDHATEVADPAGRAQESVAALGARVGADARDVLVSALRGRLGSSVAYQDGALHVAASETELHREFPAYAARAVADAQGWLYADTRTVNQARLEIGRPYDTVVARAGGTDALPRDFAGRPYVQLSVVREARARRP